MIETYEELTPEVILHARMESPRAEWLGAKAMDERDSNMNAEFKRLRRNRMKTIDGILDDYIELTTGAKQWEQLTLG